MENLVRGIHHFQTTLFNAHRELFKHLAEKFSLFWQMWKTLPDLPHNTKRKPKWENLKNGKANYGSSRKRFGALFGGSKYQVYGPTAAFIPLIAGIMAAYNLSFLVLASVIAGLILMVMGLFRLGRLSTLVPHSIVVGFTIGIAVVIALSQFGEVLGLKAALGYSFSDKISGIVENIGSINLYAVIIGLLTFAITKTLLKVSPFIPAPLIALGVATALSSTIWADKGLTLIKDKYGEIPTDFWVFNAPAALPWDGKMLWDLAYFVIAIVFVSAVESLLCSRMADRLANNQGTPFNPNKELWGQGLVQIFIPLFNGFPHTGALARTATNVKVGAVSPLAGIFKAVQKLALAAYVEQLNQQEFAAGNQSAKGAVMKPTSTACTFLLLTIIFACAGAALAQAPVPSPTGRADTMVIKTELVSFPVSVTDKEGRHFTGLDRSAFTIFEDGVTQEIAFFSTGDDPASIGIVFDLSGSMNGKKSEQAKTALTRLVQSGHQDDEYSLFAFNDRTRAVLERVRDGETMERAVKHITPQGNTALYDAIAAAIEQVKQGRWAKRAVIIISDGEDNRSRTTLRKLKQMVLEAGVTVYAVITEENRLPRFFGAEDLRVLAARSGGNAFVPETAEQLDEIFDQIALEMRQQYSLAYLPTNFQDDGRWRRLKVKIVLPPNAPPLIVKAREGYYSIGSRTQPRQSGFTNARN